MHKEPIIEEHSPQPQNLDVEKATLGAILLHNPPLIEEAQSLGLEPRDFWSPAHRVIFEAMAALSDEGKSSDFFTLCNALKDAGKLDTAGGAAGVSALIDSGMKTSNLSSYIGIIKQKARLRLVIKMAADLKAHAEHPAADPASVLSTASNALELARGPDVGAFRLRRVSDCASDPLPYPLIRQAGDHFGSFLARGEANLLTGAGKTGKSTVARQFAMAAAGCPDGAFQESLGMDIRGMIVVLVTFEDSARRTYDACRLLSPDIPDNLYIMPAQGNPIFGVAEGVSTNSRPQRLPAWFPMWSEVRRVGAGLVIIDPLGSAFQGNADSQSSARAFIEALRGESDRAGCGCLVITHSTKGARKADTDPTDPGQVSGSAAFSDAARGVLVLQDNKLSMETANYSGCFSVPLDRIISDGRFVGFKPTCT